ncbi:MAG: carbohydrate ABC transporter permease [Planctomycetes bacterium]|nr:carbohydrate ABC transporter permease [Planctomycetota bacterium]
MDNRQSAIGNRQSTRRRLRSLLTHAFLIAGAVVVAFPFLWMVLTALKSEREARGMPTLLPSGWPWEWHWGNFARAWREMEPPFGTCFLNTLIVSVAVTAAVVVTSLLAGYAFARINFVGRRALFVVFLATMMVPFEVVLVPNYMLVTSARRALGLEGTTVGAFAALIVPWCANVFSIFLVTQFFRQMPQDYYDAAVLDGCGHWQFVWRIGMPMVAPALVTAGLFSFLGSWNALLWPLVVNNPGEADVLQVALSRMVRDEQEGFNLLMAASTFTILPIVFLYLAAQRRFIEGVTGTGLKG